MRSTLGGARSRRGAAAAVRRADRRADPHCRSSPAAKRRSRPRSQKVRGGARRRRRVSPRRSGRPARLDRASRLRHDRADARDPRDPGLSLVPVRMAVRARRHDRQRARSRADDRIHVADADRLRSDQHRGAADHSRLFAQRHRRHLRPHPRDAAALQENADGGPAEHLGQRDAVALDHHPRHGDAWRCSRCSSSAATPSTASPRP